MLCLAFNNIICCIFLISSDCEFVCWNYCLCCLLWMCLKWHKHIFIYFSCLSLHAHHCPLLANKWSTVKHICFHMYCAKGLFKFQSVSLSFVCLFLLFWWNGIVYINCDMRSNFNGFLICKYSHNGTLLICVCLHELFFIAKVQNWFVIMFLTDILNILFHMWQPRMHATVWCLNRLHISGLKWPVTCLS